MAPLPLLPQARDKLLPFCSAVHFLLLSQPELVNGSHKSVVLLPPAPPEPPEPPLPPVALPPLPPLPAAASAWLPISPTVALAHALTARASPAATAPRRERRTGRTFGANAFGPRIAMALLPFLRPACRVEFVRIQL